MPRAAADDIDKPEATEVTAPDGRKGQSWSMPHLVSPALRDEKDKKGHVCKVVDIVFHTEVLLRAEQDSSTAERWKQMVSESAVSMVGKLHELDLDPAFTPMKLRYYGDTGHGPNAMSWRPSAKPFSAEGGAGKKAKASGAGKKAGGSDGGKPAPAASADVRAAAAAATAKAAAAAGAAGADAAKRQEVETQAAAAKAA